MQCLPNSSFSEQIPCQFTAFQKKPIGGKKKLMAQLHIETQHSCQVRKEGDFQFAKVKAWFLLPSLLLRKCKGDPTLPLLLPGKSTWIQWELYTWAARTAWPNTAIIFLTYRSNCQAAGSDYTFLYSMHAASLESRAALSLHVGSLFLHFLSPKSFSEPIHCTLTYKQWQWEREQILGL